MIIAPLEEGWPVDFYEAPDGRCPVRDFLLRLPLVERAKVVALIDRLRAHGPTLPFPYSSQVERKIRELRAHHGRRQFRILYFGAPGRRFVLLHGFVKTTARVPVREDTTARARMEDYLGRRGADDEP